MIIVLLLLLAAVLVPKLCFGVEMKAVMTSSMEPELPVGSLLVISPTEYNDIQIGDDITFVRDANLTLVTHRVISKDDETQKITTQGIANNVSDAPTSYENVVGKVVWSIPYIGYLVIFLGKPQGKIIAVTLIISLLAISFLIDNYSSDREKSKETNKN